MNQAVQTEQMEKVKKPNMLGQKGFFIISKEKWKYLFDINALPEITIETSTTSINSSKTPPWKVG